jgi:hypothetical protein
MASSIAFTLGGKSAAMYAVNNLLFLRFICPALLSPHRYGLTSRELSATEKQLLVQITKYVQSTVNDYAESITRAPQSFVEFHRLLIHITEHKESRLPSTHTMALSTLIIRDAIMQHLDCLWKSPNEKIKKTIQTYMMVCMSELAI